MKTLMTDLSSILCIALSLLSGPYAFAHDGQVNITGSIQSNTCIVDTGSQNMTVDMGNVSSKQFYRAGDTGAAQSFVIKLVKCGDAASGVSVTFNGQVDSRDSRLLALDSSESAASGMGIAILDLDRKIVPLNDQSKKYPLTPGAMSVDLNFFAEFMANGDKVKAGDANATATFVLNYA